MSSTGRITFKNHVPDAGVPDSRQMIRSLARDHNEAIGFAIEVREVFGMVAIDHDYPVQFEVWPLYYVDAMGPVTKQQVAERFRVFGIVEGQLNRLHDKPVILVGGTAIQQPVFCKPQKRSILKLLAGRLAPEVRQAAEH